MKLVAVILVVVLSGIEAYETDCDGGFAAECDREFPVPYNMLPPKTADQLSIVCSVYSGFTGCAWTHVETCLQDEAIERLREHFTRNSKGIRELCHPDSSTHKVLEENVACISDVFESKKYRNEECLKNADYAVLHPSRDENCEFNAESKGFACFLREIGTQCGSEARVGVLNLARALEFHFLDVNCSEKDIERFVHEVADPNLIKEVDSLKNPIVIDTLRFG